MSFGNSTPKYLVLFYGVSSGANGANLGSDERDLVTLVYLVLNTEENKVSGMDLVGFFLRLRSFLSNMLKPSCISFFISTISFSPSTLMLRESIFLWIILFNVKP